MNFVLWRERCRRIFQEVEKGVDALMNEVIQQEVYWTLWICGWGIFRYKCESLTLPWLIFPPISRRLLN